MKRALACWAVAASFGLGACVEDAWRDWQGREDAGGPDGGLGPDGATPDAGIPDAGMLADGGGADGGNDAGNGGDAGRRDAGATDAGPVDAGPPCDAGACTTDWNTFQRCGPVGQTLCLPTNPLGSLTQWAFHGPASGASGTALALGDSTHVALFSAQTGVAQLLFAFSATATTALAVADLHTEGSSTGCVDAFIESMPGSNLATTLFGDCPTALPISHLFNKPFAVLSASSVPPAAVPFTNLGVAGSYETSFVDETGNLEANFTLSTHLIQGLTGGPAITCGNNNETSWWVLLDGVTLSYASACDAGTPTDLTAPASLQLGGIVRLTARDLGGVVVVAVGPSATQAGGAAITQSFTFGPVAPLALNGLSPSDVQIAQWGSGTPDTRVVLLDGANGQAYFTDLTTVSGVATWTQPLLPAGRPGVVFAAPMYPNMLFEVADGGTPRIAWMP